jgi:hypothetical protein
VLGTEGSRQWLYGWSFWCCIKSETYEANIENGDHLLECMEHYNNVAVVMCVYYIRA